MVENVKINSMNSKQKIYCSLDIETTGFDPLKEEILEVGFVMFEAVRGKLEITEEWTQVFKPSKPVSAQIFGLTGISQEELDKAPQFGEFKEFLQEKIGACCIVGHNVIFDIKFLESQGIKFSGPVVDTLELVQWLLPTHHSYNLENLMHTFGIKHPNAHRALADSKAALEVLEKLLQKYAGFPEDLKEEIQKLIEPCNFSWQSLLLAEASAPKTEKKENKTKKTKNEKTKFVFNNETVYDLPPSDNPVEAAAKRLQGSSQKVLLVVPKIQQVMELWKEFGWQPVFSGEMLFNEKKFEAILKKSDLSTEQVRFLLKILVWKYTNWQQAVILDLNLSFSGGQFRELISGDDLREFSKPAVVCTDQATFGLLSSLGLYQNRLAVIVGLNEFETAVSNNISTKVSWGYLGYLLRSFYNPETGSGNLEFKDLVTQALSDTDLFFGLVNALLQSEPPGFLSVAVNEQSEYRPEMQKVKQAAESYGAKMAQVNLFLKSKEIEASLKNLQEFFTDSPNRVRWIELAEKRCVFFNTPLEITGLVKKQLSNFKGVAFIDDLGADKLKNYFIQRLGLESFSQEFLPANASPKMPLLQTDLFSSLIKKNHNVKYYPQAKALPPGELLKILSDKALPAAVLFGSSLQVRQFYEDNYQQLKSRGSVLAQTSSGGGNKILRNFSINTKSILLATDKFIIKQMDNTQKQASSSVEQLPVKTLVLCHIPFEQFTHPYQEALSARFTNPFEEYSLPRALYNFHLLFKFFNTPQLEQVYIFEPKLAKPYWKAFEDYLTKIPRLEKIIVK